MLTLKLYCVSLCSMYKVNCYWFWCIVHIPDTLTNTPTHTPILQQVTSYTEHVAQYSINLCLYLKVYILMKFYTYFIVIKKFDILTRQGP